MANLWNNGEIIKDPFYNTSFPLNFNWISFGISLPCPALHQLLALISELKTVQQKWAIDKFAVTTSYQWPYPSVTGRFFSSVFFAFGSGFQGPCVHTLVQLALFFFWFRVANGQSPTHQAVPNLRPAGFGAQHDLAFHHVSPTLWVGEMGRFPQPPAYQNGSVVVPQTPAVPKAMQGQAPYGGAA